MNNYITQLECLNEECAKINQDYPHITISAKLDISQWNPFRIYLFRKGHKMVERVFEHKVEAMAYLEGFVDGLDAEE